METNIFLVQFAMCVLLAHGVVGRTGVVRRYYIQAEQKPWNYLPRDENLYNDYNDYLDDSLRNNVPNRVGSEYYKALYIRYTDDTFTTKIPSPAYQGIIGPIIHAEEGDTLQITLRNMVHHEISIHPHGALYTKDNEGAHYLDNTNATMKLDDRIPYGTTRTVTWHITDDFAPTADDPKCICFAYHSHNHAEAEVYAGLLGLLVSCKPGTLNNDLVHPQRTDVDAERVIYMESIDEGKSLMTDLNLDRCGDAAACHQLFDNEDGDFLESLKKDSINGFMYANMPDLSVCVGDRVAWYIFSLNAEIHAAEIHGHQFKILHQRKSTVAVFSATFVTAETKSTTPGEWLLSCQNLEHFRNGMVAYLNVTDCGQNSQNLDSPTSHNHIVYMAAETKTWNYGRTGMNIYDGGSLKAPGTVSAKLFTNNSVDRIGGIYNKSVFVEYTDDSFTVEVARGHDEEHLGILGPILRLTVGDRLTVVLLNKTPFNVSLYIQGVKFEKDQDGMVEKEGVSGAAPEGHVVVPGAVGSYTVTAPMSVSPDDDDEPCNAYMYYSATDLLKDASTGLVGPVLICRPGQTDKRTGRQRHIDREFFLYFADMDENFSWYLQRNIDQYIPGFTDIEDEDFKASNLMRSINGHSYGNLPGLKMCRDEMVAWYVLSMGANEGLHGVKFNGNNILTEGVNRDAYYLVPGTTFTGIMRAENIGNWSVSCHNTDHFMHGEKAIYTVDNCLGSECFEGEEKAEPESGITRTYYIAAVDRKHNYSPVTIHPMTGENYSDPNSSQYNRVRTDGGFIGAVYNKVLYVEYTDGTFTTEKPKPVNLGILGPTIFASVGDRIKVIFRNMATMANRNFSINPHGFRYNKSNEGQNYGDDIVTPGDGVAPGDTYEYDWTVPRDAGPAKQGPNCQGSMYQSAVDPVKDLYTGLIGPIIICKAGILDEYNKRSDNIKRQFFLLYMAWDENQSWLLQNNINEYAPGFAQNTDVLIEANKYDAVNGLVYNNLKGLDMCEGEVVPWYTIAGGLSEDYHTSHWHGNMFIHRTTRAHRGDVLDVVVGLKETAMMFCVNPGTYLVHCHVGQHTEDGMIATYTVFPKDDPFCLVP